MDQYAVSNKSFGQTNQFVQVKICLERISLVYLSNPNYLLSFEDSVVDVAEYLQRCPPIVEKRKR